MSNCKKNPDCPLSGMIAGPGEEVLKMGFSVVDITPTEECYLSGYSRDDSSRFHPETDVLDPVRAQIWAVESRGVRQLYVIAEMVSLGEKPELGRYSPEFPGRLSEACGVKPDGIMLMSVHNHQNRESLDEKAEQDLIDGAVRAFANLREVKVALNISTLDYGISRSPCYCISHIHPYDNALYLFSVRDAADNKPMALLYSYPVHNTLLGNGCPSTWNKVSPEFTGYASRFVEEQVKENPDFAAIHLDGFWGNSGPNVGEDVFTTYGDNEAVRRYGREMGEELYNRWQQMGMGKALSCELASASLDDALPTRTYDRTYVEYFGDRTEMALNICMESIGDIAMLGVNFEAFSVSGAHIRAESPFRLLIPTACVKGWGGYIPTRECFARNGHFGPAKEQECEPFKTSFDPGTEDIFCEKCLKALCDFKGVSYDRISSLSQKAELDAESFGIYTAEFDPDKPVDKLVLTFGQEYRTDAAESFTLTLKDGDQEVWSREVSGNSENWMGWFTEGIRFDRAVLTVKKQYAIPVEKEDRYPGEKLHKALNELPVRMYGMKFGSVR